MTFFFYSSDVYCRQKISFCKKLIKSKITSNYFILVLDFKFKSYNLCNNFFYSKV